MPPRRGDRANLTTQSATISGADISEIAQDSSARKYVHFPESRPLSSRCAEVEICRCDTEWRHAPCLRPVERSPPQTPQRPCPGCPRDMQRVRSSLARTRSLRSEDFFEPSRNDLSLTRLERFRHEHNGSFIGQLF